MNKQLRESKTIKKWLSIGAAIIFTILISYFTLTDVPLSDSDSLNKTLLKKISTYNSYNWRNLLLIFVGIILLPLFYLITTKKLNKIFHKLSSGYKLFKAPIQIHEEIKDVAIILVILFAFTFLAKGLYDNCCGWWNILSIRLSSPIEPLNFRNVLIGIAGAVTLIFAGWRTYIASQNRISDKNRRFDERFDNAAEALSKKLNESSFPAHLGAVSGLRALAVDSPEHTQRCLDIICSCNQWMAGYINKFVERRNKVLYSFWLLKEQDRIAKEYNQNKIDESISLNKKGGPKLDAVIPHKKEQVTLLHEKRSQEALVAISYILTEISTNNPEQLQTLDFHNKMLCGISLSDLKLDGVDFQNTYLVSAYLNNISLNKAALNRANLQGAFLHDANLEGASLKAANLEDASLDNANLEGTSLDIANLQGASLEEANLRSASLRRANLQDTYLCGANLQGASLIKANLKGASLIEVNLENAFLDEVNLEGTSLSAVNLQGAFLDNTNLQGAPLDCVNLQGASLNRANLQGASLEYVNLQGASLWLTRLQGAKLLDSNLQEALLINAQFQGAIIEAVDLSNAVILDCNLYGTTLEDIESKNVMFNNIVDIDYIDKDKRMEWLDYICQHIKSVDVTTFTQRMKAAWQAMDDVDEPHGLEIIEGDSIVNRDDPNMYYINGRDLDNLRERLQNLVNERGIRFLHNMRSALSSLIRPPSRDIDRRIKILDEYASPDKNIDLVKKLWDFIDQLIKSNQTKNNK